MMPAEMTDTPTADGPRPTTIIRIGPLAIQGLAAIILVMLLLAGVIALVVTSHASWRMLLSAGLWLAFIVYWSVAARGASPMKSSEPASSRRVHVWLLYGALILLFAPVPGLTRRFLPLNWTTLGIGFGLQTAFGLLAVWARVHLGRQWSGAITAKADHQLVRSGPYRLVRHPIYTAMLGMFIGTALVSGEYHALLAVAIISLAYWRKIRLEEHNLQAIFGEAYAQYRRDSWAILPPLL